MQMDTAELSWSQSAGAGCLKVQFNAYQWTSGQFPNEIENFPILIMRLKICVLKIIALSQIIFSD